jgi:hypothetical protein
MTEKPKYTIKVQPTEVSPRPFERALLLVMRESWRWSVYQGDQHVYSGYASSRDKAQLKAESFADQHAASTPVSYDYQANRPRTRVRQAHVIARDQKFVGDPE